MTKYNQAILSAAGEFLGLAEWPGAKHNPQIVKMFSEVGHSGVQGDETPWCAAFVGSVLASLGLPHTGKLTASSYDTYGQAVRLQDARPGDIVRLWRGSPTSWQGHVAYLVSFEGDKVILRGGNQGNRVSDAAYPIDRIVSIRRADGVAPKGERPVLRQGDKGVWVLDLQIQLSRLGYMVGELDEFFGPRVVGALSAFQADNPPLLVDAVAGPRTWKALETAKPRAPREVSEEKVRQQSRTIKDAEKGQAATGALVTIGALGSAVGAAEEAAAVAERAGGVLDQVKAAGPSLLVILVLLVGGFLIYRFLSKVISHRIEDARTGANDKI